MRKTWIRILTTGTTIGIMILIFCFSSQPAEKSDVTSGVFAEKIADILQPGWREMAASEKQAYYDSINHVIRKIGHFTEFALLGFSLRMCLESWMEKEEGWVRPPGRGRRCTPPWTNTTRSGWTEEAGR